MSLGGWALGGAGAKLGFDGGEAVFDAEEGGADIGLAAYAHFFALGFF